MFKLSRRRVATAAAVLAVGAGSMTWAATSASAAPASPAGRAADAAYGYIPRCTAADLAVWVNADSENGAAGTIYYHLDFTNTSRGTCHLYSYPGVSAANGAGKPLGVPAIRTAGVPATYVNMPAGGTAHSVLGYVDAQLSRSCKPAIATLLKVYPPDDAGVRSAFFPLPVCTTKTWDLRVWRIQPGV
jgi:Protein of unknown function (DUF4232)